MPKGKATAASAYVKGEYGRVSAGDFRTRSEERDAREATDHRTDAQRWLGDPPANRSALAHYIAKSPHAADKNQKMAGNHKHERQNFLIGFGRGLYF